MPNEQSTASAHQAFLTLLIHLKTNLRGSAPKTRHVEMGSKVAVLVRGKSICLSEGNYSPVNCSHRLCVEFEMRKGTNTPRRQQSRMSLSRMDGLEMTNSARVDNYNTRAIYPINLENTTKLPELSLQPPDQTGIATSTGHPDL